jgi:hypothetical protein
MQHSTAARRGRSQDPAFAAETLERSKSSTEAARCEMCRGNGTGNDAATHKHAKKPSGGGDEEEGRNHRHGEEEERAAAAA